MRLVRVLASLPVRLRSCLILAFDKLSLIKSQPELPFWWYGAKLYYVDIFSMLVRLSLIKVAFEDNKKKLGCFAFAESRFSLLGTPRP